MRIFTAYILIEITKVFFLSMATVSLMLSLVLGVREGLSVGLPLWAVMKATYYMMPETLGITLPVTVLLAVCTVYSRMGAANELVAVKALGIHPMAWVWPALVFAFLLSLGTIWFYEIAAVWGRPSLSRMMIQSVDEIACGVLRVNRSYSSRDLSISVKRMDGERLIKPTITFASKNGGAPVTIVAEEALLRGDHDEGVLKIYLFNTQVELVGNTRMKVPGTEVIELPMTVPERPVHRDWLAMYELPVHAARLEQQAADLRNQLTVAQGAPAATLESMQSTLADLLRQIARLRTEPYRRWANAFTCVFFALIGVSVAVQFRFESQISAFFVCFAPILVVFYPLLMIQEKLTISGTLPPIFFWTGNLVLGLAGILLLRRFIRC